MINPDLPSIRPDAPRPEFSNAAACKEWLRQLPPTNIQEGLSDIGQQLERLIHYPLPALERLKILELLRERVSELGDELGKRYRNKPVPFGALEQGAWDTEQKLWKNLETGYRQCLQALIENDAEVASFPALIAQRVMACIVAQMFGLGHAFHAIPAALWRGLHALYAFADERGVAAKRIKDGLNREDGTSSCETTHAKALLLGLADPQQLSSRQLLQLERWLDKFSARAPLSIEQPPTPKLPLVAVDLAGDGGAAIYTGQPMGERRFLDTERTALSLGKRIKFLRGGGNPAEVGLGDDCVQPGCEALLSSLYQRWCSAPPTRNHPRNNAEGKAELCFAFPAIYFFINDGTPFKQPGETLDIAPEVMADMHMFGHVTERTEKLLLARLGYNLENWDTLDQSTGGFRIVRRGTGERISQNQVVALRPPGGKHFNLAVVRWLVVNEDGTLSIGTRTLPGIPTALAVRTVTLNVNDAGPFVPAFRLSEMPAQHEPASLVLPIGWFQAGKRIQVYNSQMGVVKLVALLEKGANFDRVTYVTEENF